MKLEIVSGAGTGRTFEFGAGADVVIGRDPACAVGLGDRKVSRRHARLTTLDGAVSLEDMGSANGVKVNGRRGSRFELRDGDDLMIGDTVLRITDLPPRQGVALPPLPPLPRVKVDDATRTVVLYTMPSEEANLLRARVTPEVAEELRAENRYLRTLGEISRVLASYPSAQKALDEVLNVLRAAQGADTACVLTRASSDREWDVRGMAVAGDGGGAQVQVSLTIVQRAVDEGIAIIARDPLTDGRFQGSQSILIEGVSSAVCAPIQCDGVFKAVLLLDRRRRSDVFMERDLQLAATVANLLGLLLEKEQAEAEARQRERLAVIGEVVANLAHHAKNIIASLKFGLGTLKMALDRGQTDKVPQYVAMIEAQQGRLSDLVLNMLSYSKDRKPLRQQVRLAALLEDIVAPFRARQAETGIAVTAACEPPDLEIWGEEAGLHRAFLNLVVNAMDALAVRTAGVRELKVTAGRDADQGVVIRFRDTGCGIPPEERDRIFDVFYSTKGARGTGLGLAVVRKVVAEHGGSVSVDSEVEAWTEFTVRLPGRGSDVTESSS